MPPCVVEDILTRPDAVQFIDSTNPQDNKNLRPDDGGKTWTSKEPAAISVDLTPGTRVMGVTLTEVTGTDRAIITVFQNNAPVEETQEVPKEGVSILNGFYRLSIMLYDKRRYHVGHIDTFTRAVVFSCLLKYL